MKHKEKRPEDSEVEVNKKSDRERGTNSKRKYDWRETTLVLGTSSVFAILGLGIFYWSNPDDGCYREGRGDLVGAEAQVSSSINNPMHKNNPALFLNRARFRRKQGNLEAAQSDLDQSLKLYESQKGNLFQTASVPNSVYLEQSEIHIADKKFREALDDCTKALKNQDRSEVHTQLSYVHEKLGELEKAEAESNLAVNLAKSESSSCCANPQEVALHERAKFFWRQERLDDALKDFDAAIGCGSCDGALYGRGAILSDKGQWQRALSDFNKAILIRERDYYFQDRGWAKLELKDYQGALNDFARAIQLNPDNKNATEGRQKAEKLMGKNSKS